MILIEIKLFVNIIIQMKRLILRDQDIVNKSPNKPKFIYDYNSSAWEQFYNKTQQVNEFLTKGKYARANQRDVEDGNSRRTLKPTHTKHSHLNKSIAESTQKCRQSIANVPHMTYSNTKSNFKMTYSKDECESDIFKPSKAINLPFGKSRHPLKIVDVDKENICQNKPAKTQNTSNFIKHIRDYRSSLADITGSNMPRDDLKELLRFNMTKNEFEYAKNDTTKPKLTHLKPQISINSNPIVMDDSQKVRPRTSRRMHSVNTHTSQIVFGSEERRPMKSINHMAFRHNLSDKENTNISNCKMAGKVQSDKINFDNSFQESRSSRAQRPHMIKNVFQSQIVLN